VRKEMESMEDGINFEVTRKNYYDFAGDDNARVKVKEGKDAWAEAIKALENQGSLEPF
jgi:hypothetical protein